MLLHDLEVGWWKAGATPHPPNKKKPYVIQEGRDSSQPGVHSAEGPWVAYEESAGRLMPDPLYIHRMLRQIIPWHFLVGPWFEGEDILSQC